MKLFKLVCVVAFLLFASQIAVAAPADGDGNKIVVTFEDFGIPIDCDGVAGAELWLDFTGWFQIKFFQGGGNRNLELDVFHLDSLYTNASGDTWIWRDRGPDRYYFVTDEGGDPILHLAITGRSAWNIVGHAVINLATGELVHDAGQHPFGGELGQFWPDDMACGVLY